MSAQKYKWIISGILLVLLTWMISFLPEGKNPATPFAAWIIACMALFWVTEVIPIPITSLLPLVLFPLFGVLSLEATAAYYSKPIIYLFLGGFLLAIAIENSGVHKRIALHLVVKMGGSAQGMILGFMSATALLSQWISNTASVMVMLPISVALLSQLKQHWGESTIKKTFGPALMLGIAYSADIGGMCTPVGTPPNLLLQQYIAGKFPEAHLFTFLEWMVFALPMGILFILIGWWIMCKYIFSFKSLEGISLEGMKKELHELGTMHRDEIVVSVVFLAAIGLWIFGENIRLGSEVEIQGWRSYFDLKEMGDASVGLAAAILLFFIPSQRHKGDFLLNWKASEKIPWGVLLLFGGGFALAAAFEKSDLSDYTSQLMSGLTDVHPLIIMVLINTFVTFLTELTSNSALTNLMLPVLSKIPVEGSVYTILLPATLSASCAFMMPVASPTQAIVFGSGYVSIKQMIRAGIYFNLLGIILVSIWGYFILPLIHTT